MQTFLRVKYTDVFVSVSVCVFMCMVCVSDIGLGRESVKFIFDSNFGNTICSFDKRKKYFSILLIVCV